MAEYTVPTPVQKHGMPIIMAGRDLMASAQTGSGKTAAFLLPIIDRIISTRAPSNAGLSSQAPQAVIITPTRELAIQISEEARKFSTGTDVKTAILYGGTQTMHQANQLRRGCNILVATPGRLLDFAERGHVNFGNIQFLILDEADSMLDQGFMPDIRRAINIPSMPSKMNRQTLMFSATFPSDPASRWRIPQQLSSLTGWASRRRMRRRDADIPSGFQVREEGQVHQHPQRGWSQGEDSGVCR